MNDKELRRLFDRCDSCGSQAFVRAHKGDLSLLFCGHHFGKHEFALAADGWDFHDERHKLQEEVEASRPAAFGGSQD